MPVICVWCAGGNDGAAGTVKYTFFLMPNTCSKYKTLTRSGSAEISRRSSGMSILSKAARLTRYHVML